MSDKNEASNEERKDTTAIVVYLVSLYITTLLTLLGLYLAATRLAHLDAVPAAILVALCGLLVLGAMVPSTISSLRTTSRVANEQPIATKVEPGTLIRLILASSALIAVVLFALNRNFALAVAAAFVAVYTLYGAAVRFRSK